MIDLTKFMISDTQYIKVNCEHLFCLYDYCISCENVDVDYIDEQKNITIRFGYKCPRGTCWALSGYDMADDLLDGTIFVDESKMDLGLEWNKPSDGGRRIEGFDQCHFMSNSHKQEGTPYSSWLFNDKDGNIIFEITPYHYWPLDEEDIDPNCDSYKEFLKNYKVTVRTIIPKERFKQWIIQAKELEKKMFNW